MQCSFFRRVSIVMVLLIVSRSFHGQEPLPFPDLNLFESYLERAECSQSREEWEAIALEGERMVMARWERDLRILVQSAHSPAHLESDLAVLRQQGQETLSDEMNKRLADWILRKFVREHSAVNQDDYVENLREQRNRSTFRREDGRILRDEKGNAEILTRTSPEEYEEELAAWSTTARALHDACIARWQLSAATAFRELLSSEDEKLRAVMESRQHSMLAELETAWRRQGDILFLLEQSEYRQFRLRDQSSLRRSSERQHAEERTEEILENTKAKIRQGLDSLRNTLNEEAGTVVQDARLVDGDEWQEQFRRELNRGLELWDEAEEDFLMRRVEWEQKAGEDLAAGVEAWEQALQILQTEQRAWLVELDSLRKKGEDLFLAEFEALQHAQEEALVELDASIEANRGNLAEEVENAVGNLNRSLEMMNTSRTSIEYWLSSVPEGASFDLNKVSWDEAGIHKALLEKMNSDVMESLCGVPRLSYKYISNVQNKLSSYIKRSICIKVDDMYEDYRKKNLLQGYVNTILRKNTEPELAYWRSHISSFLKKNLPDSIDVWFEDVISTTVIHDVFSDQNIENIFGFRKPKEPDKADFDNLSSQGAANSYNAAMAKYENELLPEYEEKIKQFGAASLELLFSDDSAVKKDFGVLSEFRQNVTKIIQSTFDTAIKKSLERDAYNEAWYWFSDVYVPYSRMAEQQHDELAKTYGIIVYDTPTVPDGGYAENTGICGPIAALNDYGWETVCLDDYQLELVKARSVEAYWEREVEVAQAVWEYAVNETNSRESETITFEKNHIALENYTQALENYRIAIADLSTISDTLDERSADIAACREKIKIKQDELTQAKNEFAQLLVMAELKTADFYVGRFRTCYEDLLRERGLLPGGDSSWSPEDLGTAAADSMSDGELARMSNALELLIQGNPQGTHNELPLAMLQAMVEKLRQYKPEEDFPAAFVGNPGAYLEENLGLWRSDPWYDVLRTAQEQWTLDNNTEALKQLCTDAGKQLLARAEGILAQRELMIRTILAADTEELYSGIGAFCGLETCANSRKTALNQLECGRDTAVRTLLEERIALELDLLLPLGDALEKYFTELESDPEETGIFTVETLFPEEAQKRMIVERLVAKYRQDGFTDETMAAHITELTASLTALQTVLSGASGTTIADIEEDLGELARNNDIVFFYLSGETLFSDNGVDWNAGNLRAYTQLMKYTDVSTLFTTYSPIMPALAEEVHAGVMEKMGAWLEKNSLGSYSEDTLVFEEPEAIWNTLEKTNSLETVFSYLGTFERDYQELFKTEYIPDEIESLMECWFESVTNFILSQTVYIESGKLITQNILDTCKAELDTLQQNTAENPEDIHLRNELADVCARYRFMNWYNRVAEEKGHNFRQFLSVEHAATFLFDPDEGESAESEWDSPYGPSAMTDMVEAEKEGSLLSGTSGTLNNALEYAAIVRQVTAALNSVVAKWTPVCNDERKIFIDANKHLNSGDYTSGVVHRDGSQSNQKYIKSFSRFNETLAHQHLLIETLALYGSQIQEFIENHEQSIHTLTGKVTERIQVLENEIQLLQNDWAEYLGVGLSSGEIPPASQYETASYADLERAYAAQYEKARTLFKKVEEEKLEYRKARAIHDYAVTPYISAHAEDAHTKSVHPETVLVEAKDCLHRARIARENLEHLYQTEPPANIISENEYYRDLRESYEKQYRYLLAGEQMKVLLNGEIQAALSELEKAKKEYTDLLVGIQSNCFSGIDASVEDIKKFIDENRKKLNDPAQKLLTTLRIEKGNPQWNGTVGVDIPENLYKKITGYLSSSEGIKSEFEIDLAGWLSDLDQKALDQWSRALSWEIFSGSGGITYEEYYQSNPPVLVEYTGNGATAGATCLETDVMVKRRYRVYIEKVFRKSLIDGYGGAANSGLVDSALDSVFRYSGNIMPPKVNIPEHIAGLKKDFMAVAGKSGYNFYKFVSLTGVLGTQNKTSMLMVNSFFAKEFLWDVYSYCQTRGTNAMSYDQPGWHEKRDATKEKSCCAGADYSDISGALLRSSEELIAAAENLEEKQKAYNEICGVVGNNNVGIMSLVQALLRANERGSGRALRDIFKTAGFTDSKVSYKKKLQTLLQTERSVYLGDTPDSSELLERIHAERAHDCEQKRNELLQYIKASGADDGIANQQHKANKDYTRAVTNYIEYGLLPDRIADREQVAMWEDLITKTAGEENSQEIFSVVKQYLASAKIENIEAEPIRTLEHYVERYNGCTSTTEQDLAADGIREAFISLIRAYRAGIEYEDSLTRSYENPVFDERENLLRDCDFYWNIINDLLKEESGIASPVIEDVTSHLKERYLLLDQLRQNTRKDVQNHEWNMAFHENEERKLLFTRQIQAIHSRGAIEWKNAINRIQEERARWQDEFYSSFLQKAEVWKSNYREFLEGKETWVQTLAVQSVEIGNNDILSHLGETTDKAISDVTAFIISDVLTLPDTDSFLETLVNRELLSDLLKGADNLTSGIGTCKPALFQMFRRGTYNNAATREKIRVYHSEQNEEIKARLAYIQYDQALTMLEESGEIVQKQVEDANRATRNGFRDMLVRDGFKESAGKFVKNTTVGATLTDTLKEKHIIDGYQYFKEPIPDFTANLVIPEQLDSTTVGSEGIQALLNHALGTVDAYMKRIFGDEQSISYIRDGIEEKSITKKSYYDFLAKLDEMSESERSREMQKVRYREVQNAKFPEWVGYAPVFRDDAKPDRDMADYRKNVRFSGSGETGRIMGLFIQHKMIEGAGRAETTMPAYNRRLWDDRNSFMAAPTLRSLTDIAVAISAHVIAPAAGGLLLNTALNMMDDTVFTMMDISNGMDPLDAMESLGKKAATTYITGRIGQAFNGVSIAGADPTGGLLQSLDLTDSVIGSTLLKGTELMASNVASSTINSFNVRGLVTGGDMFDENAFGQGAFGSGALAGVAAGMVGNAVTVGMNNVNLGKDAMKVDLYNSAQINQMKGLNTFVGGLAQSGITYGITGNATFNVTRLLGTGVMEMHVGKDGFGMNFGMSGTDISVGTVATSIQGARHWQKNVQIETHADELGLDIASVLRSQYGFGDKQARIQLDSILDGTTKVMSRGGEKGKAQTVIENGKRVVYLDTYHEGMSREEQLRMGLTLQHEAYRDGVVDKNNDIETVMAVYGHNAMTKRIEQDNRYSTMMKTIIANDANLRNDRKQIAAAGSDLNKLAGYVLSTYDSSGDYWRVTKDKDGNILKIEDDGSNDVTFVDEYGNQTGFEEYTGGSRTEFLGAHLGMSKDEANEMLKKAGYSLNSETGLFEGANAKKAFDITGNNELAVGSKEKGFLGGVKDAFNSVVDDAKNLYNSAKDKAGSLWSGLKSFLSREEKTESSAEYQALEKKFKEIEGLPYADDYKNQQKLDEKGLITKDSTAMNCIGLVSYLLNFRADYSVANFEKYSMFEKLSGISNFNDLQPGDVIRFRAGTNDNHVSIWAGNGKVLESVSSTRKPGVRIDDIWRMTNYYNKVYGKKYEVDYFRYSLSEVEQ